MNSMPRLLRCMVCSPHAIDGEGADQPELFLLRAGRDTAFVECKLPKGVTGLVRLGRDAMHAARTRRNRSQVCLGHSLVVLDVQ